MSLAKKIAAMALPVAGVAFLLVAPVSAQVLTNQHPGDKTSGPTPASSSLPSHSSSSAMAPGSAGAVQSSPRVASQQQQ